MSKMKRTGEKRTATQFWKLENRQEVTHLLSRKRKLQLELAGEEI